MARGKQEQSILYGRTPPRNDIVTAVENEYNFDPLFVASLGPGSGAYLRMTPAFFEELPDKKYDKATLEELITYLGDKRAAYLPIQIEEIISTGPIVHEKDLIMVDSPWTGPGFSVCAKHLAKREEIPDSRGKPIV